MTNREGKRERERTKSIAQVVVSTETARNTLRRTHSPRWHSVPCSLILFTVSLIVVHRVRALVLRLDVLTLALINRTQKVHVTRVHQHSNITPWGGMPVGVIIAFFLAFEAVSGATTIEMVISKREIL